MTVRDAFDCQISIPGPKQAEALEAWNNLAFAFLAHGRAAADHMGACLNLAPEFPLPNVCKGFFMLLLGRKELMPAAQDALKHAEHLNALNPFPRREALYLEALKSAIAGKWFQSADLLESIAAFEATDAVAMKIAHGLRFMMGDRLGMLKAMRDTPERFDHLPRAKGFMLGCRAFAQEEMGDYDKAEKSGRAALELASDDAWGLHAVAHVYDMNARADAGIKWLETQSDGWAHCNNFGYHVWWHLALFYLDNGDYEKVLAFYDEDIRKDQTDDYRDISNATSLLVRLEAEGVDVGDRWEELAKLSANRADDQCVIFADLHYLMALGRAHDVKSIETLVGTMRSRAARMESDMDKVAEIAGLGAAEGMSDYYRGDYDRAFTQLVAARRELQKIGGSHAQRDVFERLTIDAGIKAGRYGETVSLIEDRKWRRGGKNDQYGQRRLRQLDFAGASGSATLSAGVAAAPSI